MRSPALGLIFFVLLACQSERHLPPAEVRGAFAYSPVAVTLKGGAVDLYVVSRDGNILRSRCQKQPCDASAFGNWERGAGEPPGGVASAPAVAAWDERRIDLFVLGRDRAVWHQTWDKSMWLGWESLGGNFVSAPTATAWTDRFDVFGVGTDGTLFHSYCLALGTPACRAGNWVRWEPSAGRPPSGIEGDPSAVSWAANRIDIVALGRDGSIQHQAWEEKGWAGWKSLGGEFDTSPVLASRGSGQLDAFVVDRAGALWLAPYAGKKFKPFKNSGTPLATRPAAFGSRTATELFAPDAEGATLVHVRCDAKNRCAKQD